MILTQRKNLPVYEFEFLQKFSTVFQHGITTRNGGVSRDQYDSLNVRFGIGDDALNVQKNRRIISDAFGFPLVRLFSANQTHSNHVQILDESFTQAVDFEDTFNDVDAIICNRPNIACMIQVADCQAQILFDPVRNVFGVVHAGWKGLSQDISGTTIRAMEKTFGSAPGDIIACIAPSLGPCCSYFSSPKTELPEHFHSFIDDKNRVDLWSFATEQLRSHSIKAENIELTKVCTQCQGKDFFSYRRDKTATGRFGIIAMLRQ